MGKKCFPKLNIAGGRKPYHGENGFLNHYHIQCDPYLDLGTCSIIGIPSALLNA